MQSPTRETSKISPTEHPQALEDYRNPSHQNHTPQFSTSGGICGVFQYTTPEARSQQTNKPPTLTTLIKQCKFQKHILQTIQAAEQTQQILQK